MKLVVEKNCKIKRDCDKLRTDLHLEGKVDKQQDLKKIRVKESAKQSGVSKILMTYKTL